MKTFQQFNEDIKQRTMQLRQRQLGQAKKERAKVASYWYAKMQEEKERKEREKLKKEIKRELKRDR